MPVIGIIMPRGRHMHTLSESLHINHTPKGLKIQIAKQPRKSTSLIMFRPAHAMYGNAGPYNLDNPYSVLDPAYSDSYPPYDGQASYQANNHYTQQGSQGAHFISPDNPYAAPTSWIEYGITSTNTMKAMVPATAVAFDPFEELAWTGSQDGRLSCLFSGSLEKRVCVPAHTDAILDIIPSVKGVTSLSAHGLRFHDRGGLLRIDCCNDDLTGAVTMAQIDASSPEFLVATDQPSMVLYDVSENAALLKVDTDAAVTVTRCTSHVVGCGTATGTIELRDPRTLKVEHKVQAHTASISDIDIKNNIIVSCGLTHFGYGVNEQYMFDPVVNVYDTRTFRPLPPLQTHGMPCLLRFLPKFTSTMVVVSGDGTFQLLDTEAGETSESRYQVRTNASLLKLAISTSGQTIIMGDSDGLVHQWADREGAVINSFSQPTEVAGHEPLPYTLDESEPLAFVDMSYGHGDLLSDNVHIGGLSGVIDLVPPVDVSLIKGLRFVDNVGSAPTPGEPFRGNHVASLAMFARQQAIKRMDESPVKRKGTKFSRALSAPSKGIPVAYDRVKIDIPRLGLYAFDFSQYNQTEGMYTGLDNLLPNSYCNPVLQALYFIPVFRNSMLNHSCEKVACLSCELGFLFHMLDNFRGNTAEPRNFLRVLRQIPEAATLGLVGSDASTTDDGLMLATKIQDCFQFVIEYISKTETMAKQAREKQEQDKAAQRREQMMAFLQNPRANPNPLVAPDSLHHFPPLQPSPASGLFVPGVTAVDSRGVPIGNDMGGRGGGSGLDRGSSPGALEGAAGKQVPVRDMFGAEGYYHSECRLGKHESSSAVPRDKLCYQLVYPDQSAGKKGPIHFCDILSSSLLEENTTKVWCERCSAYQLTRRTSRLSTLPSVLVINCNIQTDRDLQFWRTGGSANEDFTARNQPNTATPSSAASSTNSTTEPDQAWLPLALSIQLPSGADPHRPPVVQRIRTAEVQAEHDRWVNGGHDGGGPKTFYQLSTVIAHILDSPDKESALNTVKGEHLVAHVRVPDDADPTRAHWYLFNDFVINSSGEKEAVAFQYKWKQPCVLVYTRVDIADLLPPPERVPHPILGQVLYSQKPSLSLYTNEADRPTTFIPLGPRERPSVVAIDCEFVAVEKETVTQNHKGKKQVKITITL